MKIELLRKTLDEVEPKIGKANHYDLLGVARSADEATLKRAFFEKAKVLHADAYGGMDVSEYRSRMARAFGELSRVHALLADPKQRADYDAKLALEQRGVPTDVRRLFQAEEALRNGKRLLERGHFAQAAEKLAESVTLNPSDVEAAICLEWASYSAQAAAGGGDARGSLHLLQELAAKAPKSDSARLYMGHLARALNRVDDARAHYEAALAINANNLEAQSNLRLLRMRQAKAPAAEAAPGLFQRFFGKR